MGENTSQIEREIDQRRAALGRNLDELEDKARELTDWRTHYRSHSGVFLGIAFGAGALLALAAVPRTTRRPSLALGEPDSHDPHRATYAAWAGRPVGGTRSRAVRQLGETWEQITDGLLRMASARAIQFVSELVPEVRDYLDRRESRPTDIVSH